MRCPFPIRTAGALMLLSLGAISGNANAMLHPAYPTQCHMNVSDLLLNGKPATYGELLDMHGVFVASTGTIATPPARLPNGRKASLFVERNGCVRINEHKDFLR